MPPLRRRALHRITRDEVAEASARVVFVWFNMHRLIRMRPPAHSLNIGIKRILSENKRVASSKTSHADNKDCRSSRNRGRPLPKDARLRIRRKAVFQPSRCSSGSLTARSDESLQPRRRFASRPHHPQRQCRINHRTRLFHPGHVSQQSRTILNYRPDPFCIPILLPMSQVSLLPMYPVRTSKC